MFSLIYLSSLTFVTIQTKEAKMRTTFIFSLCFIISQIAFSQTIFQQTYGVGKGIYVEKTNNGFLLIAENETEYLKITTDLDGNLINTTSLGAKTKKIIRTLDNGFAKLTVIPDSLGAQIEKLDAAGNTVWTKSYQFFPLEQATDFIQTTDGGFAFVMTVIDSTILPPQFNQIQIDIVKTNANGDVEWNTVTNPSEINAYSALLIQKTDGSFVAATLWKENIYSTAGIQTLNFSIDGTYLGASTVQPTSPGDTYLHHLEFKPTADNNFIYSYSRFHGTSNTNSHGLHFNKIGTWSTENTASDSYGHGTSGNFHFYSTVPTSDGGAILCADIEKWGIGLFESDTISYTLRKVDQLGNTSWTSTAVNKAFYGIELDNHFYALTGEQDSLVYLLLMDGDQGITLTGNITADLNSNCQADATEEGLGNWMVSASTPTSTFYGLSDSSGNYSIALPPGNYDVKANSLTDYWDETCTGVASITISDYTDLDTVNFYPHATIECPSLSINISSPEFHACDTIQFMVDYENVGTIVANDVFAQVSFHEKIVIDSASTPYSNLANNIYNFGLPPLNIGEGGQFQIFAHIACDVVENQALFAQAKIFPDEFCNTSPLWDQSHISITGACEADSVAFFVSNVGDGNMQGYSDIFIIEDIVLGLVSPVKITSGDTKTFRFAKDGTSYYLMSNQTNGHPGQSKPRLAIEGCGTNASGSFSTGNVLQYPKDDEDFFVSMDQKEVKAPDTLATSSQNSPAGYGSAHYINTNQAIDYYIAFKNKKDDTITHIVIDNIISNSLDLSTLQMGASSHPYRLQIIGDTLRFIFENIELPQSEDNVFKSKGFVNFKIDQKPDLAEGTIINNQSFIYLDQDAAITTTTIFNTVGKDFVIVSNDHILSEKFTIQAIPNPITEFVQFKINDINFKKGQLDIMTTTGQQILTRKLNTNTLVLPRNLLPNGTLFFIITLDGLRHTGKLIVL